jgi:hypothetical protein
MSEDVKQPNQPIKHIGVCFECGGDGEPRIIFICKKCKQQIDEVIEKETCSKKEFNNKCDK